MIEVQAEIGVIRLAIPTTGLSPEQVDDFVSWLRVEAVARRSKLLTQDAWRMSEQTKADWWARNQARFGD